MEMIQRHITGRIIEALSDRPVVLLNGARQTGKSTLVQWICKQRNIPYFTLDDFTLLSAVKSDPAGFLAGVKGSVAIDEVQRIPELFLAIKADVDRNRRAGRFLLTGSANVMLLPKMAETLVGRMEILSLWPFSRGELSGNRENFLNLMFSEDIPNLNDVTFDRNGFFQSVLQGGYPEVLQLRSDRRRVAWFRSYISTLLQRDVKDLSQIEGLSEMPRLLSLIAAQSCSLLNMSELSRDLGISHTSMKRYMTLLQAVFIVRLLPAWFGNVGKRLIKAPKAFLNDTGLLAYLSGINADHLLREPGKTGAVVENFVMQEFQKQISWHEVPLNLFYYRTAGGREVDFILETMDGRIVGVEVKSASTVQANDFKGLRDLAETIGDRFHRGVILYVGPTTVPFAKNLYAIPIRALWS